MEKIDYLNYKRPSDFLKFEPGKTTIRIVSSGGLSKKHGMKTARGYIPMGECTGSGCEQCQKGSEPKLKFTWVCLDRTNSKVGILESGPQLGNQICELAKSLQKDPREFDLVVLRSGTGKDSSYKVTKAVQNSELTPEESAKVAAEKPYLIRKYFDSDTKKKTE